MKVMVLFSGGVDSTTCLAMAIDKYGVENVIPLSIHYGQKHSCEIQAAEKILNYYGLEGRQLDLSFIFSSSNCSLLQHSSEDIPEESYLNQIKKGKGNPVSTYVPFRNGLFLSCAASMAISLNCTEIYYGAHSDDAAGNAYPDCSKAFDEAMRNAIYEGSGKKVTVVTPFIGKSKADVVKKGLLLHVPYELTWSCYEGHEKACGRCGTCRDRIRAFQQNGVKDPISYEEDNVNDYK